MNVTRVLLPLLIVLLPVSVLAQTDNFLDLKRQSADLTSPGNYQIKLGVKAVIVYAEPPTDPPPDCNAQPDACVGVAVPDIKMRDCNEVDGLCPAGKNLNKADSDARVHVDRLADKSECEAIGIKWCKGKSLFNFGSVKNPADVGYIQRKDVDPLPYFDKFGHRVEWGKYGLDLFEKNLLAVDKEARERIAADKKHDPKTEVIVSLEDPSDAKDAGCAGCEKTRAETEARLIKDAREAEAKSYAGGGCQSYPITQNCDARANGNGFGFLAHPVGNQCAICFTQQIAKNDFCGDPLTMPTYKLENMTSMLVKKSEALCKAAADQFSKMCSPWKTLGTTQQRKGAISVTEGQLINSFHPDERKVVAKTKTGDEVHLERSKLLTQNLMECLMDREDTTADPAVPNYTLCDDKHYKQALRSAESEVRAMKRSKKPDKAKIAQAERELATFKNENDSGPHDRPFILSSIKRYHEDYLSSATGLDMVTRSTLHHMSSTFKVFDNQCSEFKGYWSNIDHNTSDPMVRLFFGKETLGKRQCKEADASGADGDDLFAERLFGLKSKDPAVQLEVQLQTLNLLLNLAAINTHGNEAVIRKSLKDWFGGRTPGCFVNEVMACSACLDKHSHSKASCLELTHPSSTLACQSVSAIVKDQLRKLAKTKARQTRQNRKNADG